MDSDMALAQEKEDAFQLTGAKRTLMAPQISKGELSKTHTHSSFGSEMLHGKQNLSWMCWSRAVGGNGDQPHLSLHVSPTQASLLICGIQEKGTHGFPATVHLLWG